MNCMKCGVPIPEGQVFCDHCLELMKAHPIRPGAHIHLPKRATEVIDPKKPVKKKRTLSPEEQIAALMAQAKAILPGKTEQWAKVMGVTPMGVRISRAKKRFGSCSAENRIAYSYRLMAYPEEVIDYVVVHELAHIRHKNHSADFYAFVARFLPDYKAREAILKHK